MDFTIADHAFFFVIGIFLPMISLMSERASADMPDIELRLPPKKHIYYQNGLMLVIGALIVLTIWNINERSWDLFGFVYPETNVFVWAMVGALVILYAGDSLYSVFSKKIEPESKKLGQILPQSWSDYGHFTFLALAAGVCEEIIFRGFMINYILGLMGNSSLGVYLAIVIPAVIFSISHIYQGVVSVFKIFVLSLLFGAIYIYSKSLLLVIIIHVLVDLISGALMVQFGKKEDT